MVGESNLCPMNTSFKITSFTGTGTVVTGGSGGPSVNGLNVTVPTGATSATTESAKRPHLRLVR
jgi:hypothetical protein